MSEIKPPVNANSTSVNESGLAKVGLEMQYMLNKLIKSDVQDPVVGGILSKGYVLNIGIQTLSPISLLLLSYQIS